MQCAQAQIADSLGVGHATIERRLPRPEYREVMKRGYALGRISLRRMQMQVARAGNTAMLIWLGKQYLGQSNNPAPQPGELPSLLSSNLASRSNLRLSRWRFHLRRPTVARALQGHVRKIHFMHG
jgi:hypothetical protein